MTRLRLGGRLVSEPCPRTDVQRMEVRRRFLFRNPLDYLFFDNLLPSVLTFTGGTRARYLHFSFFSSTHPNRTTPSATGELDSKSFEVPASWDPVMGPEDRRRYVCRPWTGTGRHVT